MRLRNCGNQVLMGRGFEWTPAHVEALLRYRKLRRSGEYPSLRGSQSGTAVLHGVGADTQRPVCIPEAAMRQHVGIQGLTETGKSVAMTSLAVQAIHRKGGCVVVIDPKGDDYLIGHVIQAARESGRKFALFAPYFPHLSTHLNPLSTCQTPEEVEARIRPILPPTKEPYWINQPMSRVLTMARLHQAIGKRWTFADLYRDVMVRDHRTRAVAEYIRHLGVRFDKPDPSHGVVISQYRKSGLSDPVGDEAVALLDVDLSRYDEVMSNFRVAMGGIANNRLLSANHALSWEQITRERMVVLVLTTFQLMGDTGNTLGRLILQDFMGYCGHRQSRSTEPVHEPMSLFIDEIGRIGYDGLADQIATIRSANGRLVGAWQSRAGVMRAMGQYAAQELFGNFRTQLYFAMTDEDPMIISRELGMCEIPKFNTQANLRTGKDGDLTHADSTGKKNEKEPLIDSTWFRKLPKGQCYMSHSGTVYKLVVPYLGNPDYRYSESYRDIIHALRSQPVAASDDVATA